MSRIIDLETATEVFVHAFAQGKSRTYPYEPRRHGGLWVMRDTPDRKKARKIEVVGVEVPPGQVVSQVSDLGLGWHFYCDIVPVGVDIFRRRDAFKLEGYRAMSTEWMFAHDLESVPEFRSKPPVCLAIDEGQWDRVPQRTSQRRPWFLEGRQYYVTHPTRSIGFVRSVPFGEDAWVSDLFVHQQYRRQGYGRALMSRLLRDDKAHGVRNSVLLASKAGAQLYPLVGYQLIGVLQVFCPVRESAKKS